MVRAILEGRKTQTRRVVKFKPQELVDTGYERELKVWMTDEYGDHHIKPCPYGQPGDRLWVRETWGVAPPVELSVIEKMRADWVIYRADGGLFDRQQRWRPSIHMPRWASRITLEIMNVRVERLQGISEEDAKAEGITELAPDMFDVDLPPEQDDSPHPTARDAFENLWDSINAERGYGWEANPWVWVIEFKRLEAK
jgi:hypothetical protein